MMFFRIIKIIILSKSKSLGCRLGARGKPVVSCAKSSTTPSMQQKYKNYLKPAESSKNL